MIGTHDRYGEIFYCPAWMTPAFCRQLDDILEHIEIDADEDEITLSLCFELQIDHDTAEACQRAREILNADGIWRLPGSWRVGEK